jgi:hypothetical protein
MKQRAGYALPLVTAACALVVAACGGSPGSTTQPPASAAAGLRGFSGADGTLVQIASTSMILAGSTGIDTTVDYTGSTPVTQTSTGSFAQITVGSCVTVTGTKDATGAITASSVGVSPAVNGSCAARAVLGGSPRAFPSGRPSGSFTPRATPSGIPANLASIRGMVTALSGTTLSVQGTETAFAGGAPRSSPAPSVTASVTVPTSVTVDFTAPGSDADLTDGVCVLAVGSKSTSGTVTASSLSIEPPGPSGCFTGGRGAGGFLGGGGFLRGGGGSTSG